MKRVLSIAGLWIPVLIWMGIIFFLSSQPTVRITSDRIWDFLWYKLAHITEYAVLNMLIFRAWWWAGGMDGKRKQTSFVIAFTVSVLYAISDEIHQLYVPTREGRLRDIFVDMIGVAVGGYIGWKFIQTPQRRQEK